MIYHREMTMNPETEAYEYGKRLGSDYHGKMPMATVSEAIEDLESDWRYRGKLLPALREIAGYNNRNTVYPTVTKSYRSDCFRDSNGNEELLKRRVKPAFWHGFKRGFGY